jgi:subtilisin family serine protease
VASNDPHTLRLRELQKIRRRGVRGDLAPRAGEPPTADSTERATDTVIVKLRAGSSTARDVQRATASRALERSAQAPGILARLVENGYARFVTPVFAPAAPVAAGARGRGVRVHRGLTEGAVPPADDVLRNLRKARGLVSVRVEPGTSPFHLAAHLTQQGDEVEYAFVPPVKYPVAKKAAPRPRRPRATNDALSARQWGHGAVRIREARARRGFRDAAAVVVAVVDSGIDASHPDLDGAIHSYVNFLPSEDDRDYKAHGTHVAGIIAAEINNRIGIAGICAARIMALKALPRKGKPWNAEAYYRALAYPIGKARVLNLSIGGGEDPAERDIIADVLADGIVVVAAMGNEFEEGNPTSYPAAYDGVVAVGASDEVDRRASFSCTGPHISLVAPGVNIISTVPQYATELAEDLNYDSWPGTSMAAPHVAAAAALLLTKRPRLTPAQVRDRLRSSADRVTWQRGRPDDEYGFGRLNVEKLLR